jgi:molybdate transport system substrate-binding protein
MEKRFHILFIITVFTMCLMALPLSVSAETLTAFIGSATKPAMEEINKSFTKKYGVEILAHYGGSGNILSQLRLSGTGDIYLSGSPDFMEKAKKEGVVDPASIRIVAYLIPVINVQKGNPKNITCLQDLKDQNVQLLIANPRVVCVGLYAVEIFEANNLSSELKPRILSYTESCARTANIIAIGGADAVIGWRVFQYWNPGKIQSVLLKPEQIPRISYILMGISLFSKKTNLAAKYLEFVVSPESKQIFKKWGYITEEQDARKYSPHASIGGEYPLPEGW